MVPTVPNGKALVLYGRRYRPGGPGYHVMAKGGRSPLPVIEAAELMDIGPQKIEIDHRDIKVLVGDADGKAGARVSALLLVPDEESMLFTAAEHLLHVNFSDVRRWASTFMEAHLRGLMRKRTFEQASNDLMGTAAELQEMVNSDLSRMGLLVQETTIHELKLRGG